VDVLDSNVVGIITKSRRKVGKFFVRCNKVGISFFSYQHGTERRGSQEKEEEVQNLNMVTVLLPESVLMET
jgi:hypothetical protein